MIQSLYHRNFKEIEKYYSLHWAVTNNCNFKCAYCGVYKDEKIYDFENIIEYINFIGTNNHVDTVLFGGEPLIHPNILEIVRKIETDIRICTNLSKSISFFRELIRVNHNVKVIASFHYEKDDWVEFYQKISYLIAHVKFVKVKIMWDSRYKEECKEVYKLFRTFERFDNFKLYLDLVYHDICKFSDEDLKYFNSIQNDNRFWIHLPEGGKFVSYNEVRRKFNGFPNFLGWKCYTGKKGLFIDSNGDVCYCQTKRNKGKAIFNLNEDDFTKYLNIFTSHIICDENDFCCEVVIPRRK